MINIRHRPQPPDPCVRRRRPVFRPLIRNRKRHVAESQSDLPRVRILCRIVKRRSNRRKHAALQPCRRHSIRAQRRLEIHRRHRMERIKLDVVFPAPDHLHRLPRLLRKHRRFHDEIRKRFPPKPAAQQRHVHRHIFFLHVPPLPATASCAPCGFCVGAQISTFPSLYSPAPRAAPSKHAPASARNIALQSPSRPSQTPHLRFRLRAPLFPVSSPSLPAPCGTHPNSKLACSLFVHSTFSFFFP